MEISSLFFKQAATTNYANVTKVPSYGDVKPLIDTMALLGRKTEKIPNIVENVGKLEECILCCLSLSISKLLKYI